jgi:hypothetical protein
LKRPAEPGWRSRRRLRRSNRRGRRATEAGCLEREEPRRFCERPPCATSACLFERCLMRDSSWCCTLFSRFRRHLARLVNRTVHVRLCTLAVHRTSAVCLAPRAARLTCLCVVCAPVPARSSAFLLARSLPSPALVCRPTCARAVRTRRTRRTPARRRETRNDRGRTHQRTRTRRPARAPGRPWGRTNDAKSADRPIGHDWHQISALLRSLRTILQPATKPCWWLHLLVTTAPHGTVCLEPPPCERRPRSRRVHAARTDHSRGTPRPVSAHRPDCPSRSDYRCGLLRITNLCRRRLSQFPAPDCCRDVDAPVRLSTASDARSNQSRSLSAGPPASSSRASVDWVQWCGLDRVLAKFGVNSRASSCPFSSVRTPGADAPPIAEADSLRLLCLSAAVLARLLLPSSSRSITRNPHSCRFNT